MTAMDSVGGQSHQEQCVVMAEEQAAALSSSFQCSEVITRRSWRGLVGVVAVLLICVQHLRRPWPLSARGRF